MNKITTTEEHKLENTPYADFVLALVKDGQAIIDSLTPEKADLWHMGSCVMPEAGELFDAIKKYVIYEKDLDLENIIEELGDIEFYLQGIRNNLGISREECIRENKKKLSKRYASLTFSNQAAQERADKVVEEVDKPEESEPMCYMCAKPRATCFCNDIKTNY